MENSEDRQTGTRIGCAGTINTGENQKLDNPHKGIQNPIPRNPDSPLKRVQNLVPNGIRIHWTRGLIVPN